MSMDDIFKKAYEKYLETPITDSGTEDTDAWYIAKNNCFALEGQTETRHMTLLEFVFRCGLDFELYNAFVVELFPDEK